MTLILHTSVKGEEKSSRERRTWHWFDVHEKEMERQGWDIAHVMIPEGEKFKFNYDGVIRHFWATDDLLVWERDMVPRSFQQIVDLVNCPEDACAIDYPLYRCYIMDVETKDPAESLTGYSRHNHLMVCAEHLAELSMMRNVKNLGMADEVCTWSDGTWDHADLAPLGLTRYRKRLMEKLSPAAWPQTHWLDVDQIVGKWLYAYGFRTHIHYPLAIHNRTFLPNECAYVGTLPRTLPIVQLKEIRPNLCGLILQAHRQDPRHNAFVKVRV